MPRTRTLAVALAALALTLAACGAAPSDEASRSSAPAAVSESAAASASAQPSDTTSETVTVRLEGFAFDTAELTIAAGTTVRFVNADGAPHTVTEGSDGTATDDPIVDEQLAQNGTTSVTFDEPGTYQITCRIHPSMNMTVIVE